MKVDFQMNRRCSPGRRSNCCRSEGTALDVDHHVVVLAVWLDPSGVEDRGEAGDFAVAHSGHHLAAIIGRPAVTGGLLVPRRLIWKPFVGTLQGRHRCSISGDVPHLATLAKAAENGRGCNLRRIRRRAAKWARWY